MISVCMTSCNGEVFIKQQIDSILSQLGQGDELIISDDESTDSSLAIINSYKDPRIRLLKFSGRNLIKNFENALKHAKGDIIFLADQDDVWLPQKIKTSVETLKQGHLLVVSDCTLIDENNKVLAPSFFALKKPHTSMLKNLYTNSFMGCCMAFKKEVLSKALPFPKNLPMHDSWIGQVAKAMGSVALIEEPLILYRRHDKVMSTTGFKSQRGLLLQLKDRWQILSSLILRLYAKRPL